MGVSDYRSSQFVEERGKFISHKVARESRPAVFGGGPGAPT